MKSTDGSGLVSSLTVPRRPLPENNVVLAQAMSNAPKYAGLCGTALCFVMNPKTGNMVQVRALLDSGANLTMINQNTAHAIGLTGSKIQISIYVAGGGCCHARNLK